MTVRFHAVGTQSTLAVVAATLAIGCGTQMNAPQTVLPRLARSRDLGTASSGYDFAYDVSGRLTVVATPNGEVAQYVYDPTGNILSIQRPTVGTLTILGFSPPQGAAGQVITV